MARTTLGKASACCWLLVFWIAFSNAVYAPVRQYSGSNFFDEWDYYGDVDNTTWGNVTYVDQSTGASQRLTYVDNNSGHAIIRVDNTTNITSAPLVHRNSVRITSKDAYPIGSLVIIDAVHVPYGCSVWPSFWTLGTGLEWPHAGEIDIIESINLLSQNQMALHTDPGCFLAANTTEGGKTLQTDCSQPQGCLVQETKANSFGSGFANAGGGVFAMQFDVAGIYMWFWSRPSLPPSISNATSSSSMDLADWGPPTAAYPAAGCNFTKFFTPQQLVVDITLCGDWAGVPDIYASTCPGQCISNIIGAGNPVYDTAYWEISYIRTYLAGPANSTTSAGGGAGSTTATALNGAQTGTSTGSSEGTTSPTAKSSGLRVRVTSSGVVVMLLALLLAVM